jgi:IMP cyclohydrolase
MYYKTASIAANTTTTVLTGSQAVNINQGFNIDYMMYDGDNYRQGQFMAVTSDDTVYSGIVTYAETSTTDIGQATEDVQLIAINSADKLTVQAVNVNPTLGFSIQMYIREFNV